VGISISISPAGSNAKGDAMVGGTSEMMPLLSCVADIIRESRPDIYEESFDSLDWGEVNLHALSKQDYAFVKSKFDEQYRKFSAVSNDKDEVDQNNWKELINKLSGDPRVS
jgi:hypothetical protein